MKTRMLKLGIVALLIACCVALVQSRSSLANAESPAVRTAVFAVACYDVGKSALDGLAGVVSVKTGWRGRSEVNEVRYDPQKVSVSTMESALRRAGTYIRTVDPGS